GAASSVVPLTGAAGLLHLNQSWERVHDHLERRSLPRFKGQDWVVDFDGVERPKVRVDLHRVGSRENRREIEAPCGAGDCKVLSLASYQPDAHAAYRHRVPEAVAGAEDDSWPG